MSANPEIPPAPFFKAGLILLVREKREGRKWRGRGRLKWTDEPNRASATNPRFPDTGTLSIVGSAAAGNHGDNE